MKRILAAALLLAVGAARTRAAFEIRADPRVELIGLVQQLAGDNAPGWFSPGLGGYGFAALKRFSAWHGHAAVRSLRAMTRRGFRGALPAQYVLYLSAPPELAVTTPIPDFFADAAGGRAQLESFRSELADFARESDFSTWYDATASSRAATAAELRRTIAGVDVEKALADYLGFRPWADWVVVPSALFPEGRGSDWIVESARGRPDVYVVIGPHWKAGRPAFGGAPEIVSALWREAAFSAAYVMTALCPGLRPRSDVCAGMSGSSTSEDCVERIWVEAALARLRRRVFGPQADRARYRRTRFARFAAVESSLQDYESQRARYPTLVEFTPRLCVPLQDGGAVPPAGTCPVYDASDEVGQWRLGDYLDGRLAQGGDAGLFLLRARLRLKRGDRSGARADLAAARAKNVRDEALEESVQRALREAR